MFFVVRAIICSFILIYHTSGDKKFLKPSFAPYCAIKKQCKSACSCQGPPDCMLIPMDDTIREIISMYHNQIRQIQTLAEPQPSGLTLLEYDRQLEEISKCWALKCKNEYSTCFFTPSFPETSQSVIQLEMQDAKEANVFHWIQILNFWFGETKSLTADSINVLPGGENGEWLHNYAQLVGDKSRFVGCAWSYVNDSVTFVCSYGPRGPVWGEPIYKIGKACTSCPEGYACDNIKPFQNLCKRGVGVSTISPVETPPLPPPLLPVTVPPSPPPLAAIPLPLSSTTSPPQPPPVPPESSCNGSSGCKEIQKPTAFQHGPILSVPGSDSRKASKYFDPSKVEDISGTYSQGTRQQSNDHSKSDIIMKSSIISGERRMSPTNHIRLAQNKAPLIPLRHTLHTRPLSSLSSKSIARISSAIAMNRSHLQQSVSKEVPQKPQNIMEAIDSEPSQLVPSYHSTYDSPLNEQGQFFPSFGFQPPKPAEPVVQDISEFKDDKNQLSQQSQSSYPMNIYPQPRQEELKSVQNQYPRHFIPNTQSIDLQGEKPEVDLSLQPSSLRLEGMEPMSPENIPQISQTNGANTISPKSPIVQPDPLHAIKSSHSLPPTSRAPLGGASGRFRWGNYREIQISSSLLILLIFQSLITFCNGQ